MQTLGKLLWAIDPERCCQEAFEILARKTEISNLISQSKAAGVMTNQVQVKGADKDWGWSPDLVNLICHPLRSCGINSMKQKGMGPRAAKCCGGGRKTLSSILKFCSLGPGN